MLLIFGTYVLKLAYCPIVRLKYLFFTLLSLKIHLSQKLLRRLIFNKCTVNSLCPPHRTSTPPSPTNLSLYLVFSLPFSHQIYLLTNQIRDRQVTWFFVPFWSHFVVPRKCCPICPILSHFLLPLLFFHTKFRPPPLCLRVWRFVCEMIVCKVWWLLMTSRNLCRRVFPIYFLGLG